MPKCRELCITMPPWGNSLPPQEKNSGLPLLLTSHRQHGYSKLWLTHIVFIFILRLRTLHKPVGAHKVKWLTVNLNIALVSWGFCLSEVAEGVQQTGSLGKGGHLRKRRGEAWVKVQGIYIIYWYTDFKGHFLKFLKLVLLLKLL